MKLSYFYILLLALNLAGFPLVAGLATYVGGDSTTYSIAMRAAVFILSILFVVVALVGKRIKFANGLFWLPLTIFWFAYLLRIYVDTVTDPVTLSKAATDYWIWAIGACFVPMLGLLTYPKKDYFSNAYKLTSLMLVLASFFVATLGSGLFTTEFGMVYESGRLRLDALNPISVGHLGLSLLLLSVWPFISAGPISLGYKQFLNIAAGLLGLYLLISAASRGPFVALIFVLFFYFIALDFKRSWKVLAVMAILLALTSQIATRLEEAGTYKAFSRTESALSGEDAGVAGRQIAYSGALNQFIDSPFFGDSLEEKITQFYPHNVILESFMATGLFGGLSFIFLIIYGVVVSYKILKRKSEYGWIPLIFLQYLMAAQFSGALYNSATMWGFLALTIVLHRRPNPILFKSKTGSLAGGDATC